MACPTTAAAGCSSSTRSARCTCCQRGSKIFLDIGDEMVGSIRIYERLLGMALHPRFPTMASSTSTTTLPEVPGWNSTSILADTWRRAMRRAASDRPQVQQPQMNHNGGHITFGRTVCTSLGDGGGQNDRGIGHNPATGNGQDLSVLLGKILRIDVDDRSEEGSMASARQPFADGGGLPEIYAYGLRNPYHISFDRRPGGSSFDVGQTRWEKVDIMSRAATMAGTFARAATASTPRTTGRRWRIAPTEGARGEKLIDPILGNPNAANRRGGTARQ